MDAVLRVKTGQRAGEELAVPVGEAMSIGRSSESDFQLLDLGVSRFHCVIEAQPDGLSVTDLSSSNGTLVNGQPIKRQPLAKGDEVRIGPVTLVVESLPERRRVVPARVFSERDPAQARVVRAVEAHDTAVFEPRAAGVREGSPSRIQRDLAALYRIVSEINAQPGMAKLLATLLDTVLDAIHAERGFLLLVDETTGEVLPQEVRVRPSAAVDPKLPISSAVVRDAMEKRVSILCPDLMADERFRDGDALVMDHIRSALCAPLDAGGTVVGAIYLDSGSERSPFDEDDLDLLTAIARQAGMALHRAQLVESLERLFVGAIGTLVATVEAKDIYTYGHSTRVSKLARQIAERMELSAEEQETIKVAGLLHDIGKIGIPETILNKPDKLTDEEWSYIRSHPAIGESIIRQMGSDRLKGVESIVRHHHERLDGQGYPDRLAGDAIPLGARILGVADAYDAMTSNRPYRTSFTAEAAAEELERNAGVQFDARAVAARVALRVARAPSGTEVALGAGSQGEQERVAQ